MDQEQLKRIIDGPADYDEAKENTLRSMVGEFYNRKMLGTIVLVWGFAIVFVASAVYSAAKFFSSEQTKSQIMYAAMFICFVDFISLMKMFAWGMIHRNSIKREIKRLELRVAELAQSSSAKTSGA